MSIAPAADIPALPDPEVTPTADEHRPEFGENLAEGNDELCKQVMKYLVDQFWLPYYNQQMRLWPVWRKIDDMWRNKVNSWDLDWPLLNKKVERQGKDSKVDCISAMAQSPAAFKQMKALTDIIVQMSWQDGAPGKFMKPECVYEHPLYNPTQQSVDAMNELMQEQIEVQDIEETYGESVAQNEAHATYCGAQIEMLRKAGYETKRWMTCEDERVRESHVECGDQQPIPLEARFSNGLLYPHEPAAPPSETCNCRCWLVGAKRKTEKKI